MMEGAVVRADRIVEIHADIIKAGRNESHDRNEPGGGAGGTFGHTEPFIGGRWACRRQSGVQCPGG